MKILIIQQKYIGDVLRSSILCDNLKKWNNKCSIDFIVNDFTIDVISENPNIDNILIFKKEFKYNYIQFIKFLFSVRRTKYDYVIDCYSKIESNLISLFSNSRNRISYYKWYTNFIYSKTVKRFKKSDSYIELSVKNRIELIKPIIGNDFSYEYFNKIYLNKIEVNFFKKKLQSLTKNNKKNILINLLGSTPQKSYPINEMVKFIDFISNKIDCNIILNYMLNQDLIINEIVDKLEKKTFENVIDYVPKTLKEYIYIANESDAVLGNEGGAINIAKALSKATFAIFSPMIQTKGWHSKNVSNQLAVHLQDYFPELFYNKQSNYIIKNNRQLYNKFKFDLFKEKLDLFLKVI